MFQDDGINLRDIDVQHYLNCGNSDQKCIIFPDNNICLDLELVDTQCSLTNKHPIKDEFNDMEWYELWYLSYWNPQYTYDDKHECIAKACQYERGLCCDWDQPYQQLGSILEPGTFIPLGEDPRHPVHNVHQISCSNRSLQGIYLLLIECIFGELITNGINNLNFGHMGTSRYDNKSIVSSFIDTITYSVNVYSLSRIIEKIR